MDRRSFFGWLGLTGLALGARDAAGAAVGSGAGPGRVEARLAELGIVLPEATAPLAVYVPYRVSGNQVFIAGQVPTPAEGLVVQGKVGRELTTAQGYQAARNVGLKILAQLRAACGGDLDRVVQAVQIRGFVNCTRDFTEQPQVINGASELLRDVFGEAGLAARAALGTNSLPGNFACEIESVFEIRAG